MLMRGRMIALRLARAIVAARRMTARESAKTRSWTRRERKAGGAKTCRRELHIKGEDAEPDGDMGLHRRGSATHRLPQTPYLIDPIRHAPISPQS